MKHIEYIFILIGMLQNKEIIHYYLNIGYYINFQNYY